MNAAELAQLRTIESEDLLFRTQNLALQERKIQIAFLHHLKEIERRKLFLERGFSSLFDYLTKELSYSESSAYRRIQAMRLLKDIPEIETKLTEGSISLTTASLIQSHFRKQKALSPGTVSQSSQPSSQGEADKTKLLSHLENKSTREVEKHLLSLLPTNLQIVPKKETRTLSADSVELKVVLCNELKDKLDQLKNLMSHVDPHMTYLSLIEKLADRTLKQLDPAQKAPRQQGPLIQNKIQHSNLKTQNKATPQNSRLIPRALKNKIWKRDQGCCSYVDPLSKRKCHSRFQLQMDHIHPFALGGAHTEENLRLLCSAHNRRRAERTFGTRPAK